MTQGPRDIFHGLSCLLVSLGGSNSRSLNLLQGKMAASRVPFLPIPRFVEVQDDIIASPESDEINPAISPRNSEYESPGLNERLPTSPLASMHRRDRSRDSTLSTVTGDVSAARFESSFASQVPVVNHSCLEPTVSWTVSV